MKTHLYLVHALSPLHAGTGQSVGAIDLPIARERPTGIPLVPGSSIKGALRARCDSDDKHTIFGPDTDNASDFAGAVQFSDAHLLLLPVRSISGTFAWVTSPYLLQRFARDAKEGRLPIDNIPSLDTPSQCIVASSRMTTPVNVVKKLAVGKTEKEELKTEPRVVLEDLDLEPNDAGAAAAIAIAAKLAEMLFPANDDPWRKTFTERFCIVHDDVMSLLLETATEVSARIRLNATTKTVEKGALWYEEALPTESVLYGLVAASDATEKVVSEKSKRMKMDAANMLVRVQQIATEKGMLQLGGKATVGRGTCLLRVVDGGAP